MEHRVLHFDVEADGFRELVEHAFECGEGGLDRGSASVAFESLFLEVASVLHSLRELQLAVGMDVALG